MTLVIDIGSMALDSYEDVKNLYGVGNADRYTSYQNPVGTYYQVPTGKKLVITGLCYCGSSIAARCSIGYGDDTKDNDAAAPTNFIDVSGEFTSYIAYKFEKIEILIEIPALKYPCMKILGDTVRCRILGVEV